MHIFKDFLTQTKLKNKKAEHCKFTIEIAKLKLCLTLKDYCFAPLKKREWMCVQSSYRFGNVWNYLPYVEMRPKNLQSWT